MFYIDSHCHIYEGACSDVEKVIKEAKEVNVQKMFDASEDISSSKKVLEISEKYKGIIYPCIGIHPENIPNNIDNELVELEELIQKHKVIAIGEIGLDYHWTKETKDKQIYLFEKQLKLASKYNLPVIIHSRDATEDTINILNKYNVRGIIHSFSGSLETANIYIKKGFLLGINGVITFKNAKLKEVYKNIDLSHIVLETDSPFLSPEPFRGKENSPKNVSVIGKFVSELYGVSEEKIIEATYNNLSTVFDID